MNTLFPVQTVYPEGFSYTPDFLNEDEEMKLYNFIKDIELHNFNFQGFKANRKVASFGYDNSKLTKGKEIPATLILSLKK